MKLKSALFIAVLAGGLAACSPADETPELPALPVQPTVQVPLPGPSPAPAEGTETRTDTAQPGVLVLTDFTPATNEIYCSFFNIGDDGKRNARVFITEIAGVPAPAHVGLEGQNVVLTQVSKAVDASPEVWVYENAERDLQVELRVVETAKGMESRDYEGTIEVTRPAAGPLIAISGTCGV